MNFAHAQERREGIVFSLFSALRVSARDLRFGLLRRNCQGDGCYILVAALIIDLILS